MCIRDSPYIARLCVGNGEFAAQQPDGYFLSLLAVSIEDTGDNACTGPGSAGQRFAGAAFPNPHFKRMAVDDPDKLGAVSYTHLDVYKRQKKTHVDY